MKGFAYPNLELAVPWHAEALPRADALPYRLTGQQVFAGTRHALHDFWRRRSKSERCRKYHAHRLFAPVGHRQAVANTFAVKVNAGLGGDGDAGEMGGSHGGLL